MTNALSARAGNATAPWMPLFPTLWPSMIRPAAGVALPFPLSHPGRRDFVFARYAIFAIARSLGLAGREVLFPAFFHCVELEAIIAAGARVTFFPLGPQLQVDPDDLARRIGAKTAAVYVIHYAGFPAPIRDLRDLCRQRGVALIEDCAHALLSRSADEPLGSFGDAAAFSLPKSLPTPDGGVGVLNGAWISDASQRTAPSRSWVAAHTLSLLLSNLEMRKLPAAAWARATGLRMGKAAFSAAGADYVPMGTPTFDPAQADRTISALSRRIVARQDFDAIVHRRRRNYAYLLEQLRDVAPPLFPDLPAGVCPLFYPFRTNNRHEVFSWVRAQGVEIGEFWPERHPAGPNGEFRDVDEVRRTALWLPCHQDLTLDALDWLVDAVRRAVVGSSG
ncbi:MAG: perosamine synthetase [Chloroflexota bacterium]|jgi:dTDP-4-amino-4,6-dideoxygalactose transaminase|nr:perosamine synthetase [Chloroflexota bacterium]